jgi:hypothetical protein
MTKSMWSSLIALAVGGWAVWEFIKVRERRKLGESWPLILTGFSDNKKDVVIQIAVVLGFLGLIMGLVQGPHE